MKHALAAIFLFLALTVSVGALLHRFFPDPKGDR